MNGEIRKKVSYKKLKSEEIIARFIKVGQILDEDPNISLRKACGKAGLPIATFLDYKEYLREGKLSDLKNIPKSLMNLANLYHNSIDRFPISKIIKKLDYVWIFEYTLYWVIEDRTLIHNKIQDRFEDGDGCFLETTIIEECPDEEPAIQCFYPKSKFSFDFVYEKGLNLNNQYKKDFAKLTRLLRVRRGM